MFCPNCGKKIPDNSKFCSECGASTAEGAPPATPKTPLLKARGKIPAEELQQIEYCFLGSVFAAVAAVIIAMAAQSAFLVLLNIIIGVLLFIFCYKKLKEEDYDTAKTAALGIGIVCGVLGFLGVVAGDFGGLLGIGVCAALIYAFSKL